MRQFFWCLLLFTYGHTLAAEERTPESWDGSLWLQEEAGHESSPITGNPRLRNSARGEPDWFLDHQARASLTFPFPLVLREHIEVKKFSDQKVYDDTVLNSKAEAPFFVGPTTLSPFGYIENTWSNKRYFSTQQRIGLRWSQEWSERWDSDFTPFVAHTRYHDSNKNNDGTESGAEAVMNWSAPRGMIFDSISINFAASKYNARAPTNSYGEVTIGSDQSFRLPSNILLMTGELWSPSVYDQRVGVGAVPRRDRTLQIDASVRRPICLWIDAIAEFNFTRTRSNRSAQDYQDTTISVGLRATFF